jgi:hypothetical protein
MNDQQQRIETEAELAKVAHEKARKLNQERYERITREAALEAKQIRSSKLAENKRLKVRLEKVTAIIHKHSAILFLKHGRCQDHDEYGISNLNKSAWDKELNYFLLEATQGKQPKGSGSKYSQQLNPPVFFKVQHSQPLAGCARQG